MLRTLRGVSSQRQRQITGTVIQLAKAVHGEDKRRVRDGYTTATVNDARSRTCVRFRVERLSRHRVLDTSMQVVSTRLVKVAG